MESVAPAFATFDSLRLDEDHRFTIYITLGFVMVAGDTSGLWWADIVLQPAQTCGRMILNVGAS